MSQEQTIRETLQTFGDMNEISEVKAFVGFRNEQRVTVSILDLGENCDPSEIRFGCKVEQEDGKSATGNRAATAEEAIEIVHWQKLD